MRKPLSIFVLLAIMGIGKVCAQGVTLFIWDGDQRFGISGGIAVPMGKDPIFSTDKSIAFNEKSFARHMAPSFGIFSGREKDVSGDFRFGFQVWATYTPNKWTADFTRATQSGMYNTKYDYNSKQINANEDVYLAYYIQPEKLSVSLGIGIAEGVTFGSKASCLTTDAHGTTVETIDNTFKNGGAPFSMYLGANATAGVTYYLGDAFFVSLHAKYTYVAFDFSSINASSSLSMDNLDTGIMMSETIPSFITSLVTVGFKW
ncbi:MAG: hypothetical protein IJ785_05165 [Bacteroidales bacterium]|nr:hypothetical protein [Bacteroidales bacterium]